MILKFEVQPGDPRGFELWRWGVSPMFDMDAADRSARAGFMIKGASHVAPEADVSSATSSPTLFVRGHREIARSGLDCITVLTYLSGGFVLQADGSESEVRNGDIALLDMTRPSVLRTTAFTHVAITLSRSMIEPLVAHPGGLHGCILRAGTPLNTVLAGAMLTLHATSPELSSAERHAASHGIAALVASAAGSSREGRDRLARTAARLSLNALRRMIEDNLADPALGPDWLVRRFGISRATLYRLFEPLGSVRHYIQQRRLARAYQSLIGAHPTDERVSALAARFGFSSNAVFSRAFKDRFAMSPSALRAITAARRDDEALAPSGKDAFREIHRSLVGTGVYVR